MDKKNNVFKFLFFFSYFLISLYYAFQKVDYIGTVFQFIYHYILPLLLLFIVLLQKSKYKVSTFILIILLEVLGLLAYYISKNAEVFFTISFIVIGYNVELDEFIKFDLILKIILLFLVFFLFKIGLAPDVILYREDGFLRHSYGFIHPNTLGSMFLLISADLSYLYNLKKKKKTSLLFILLIMLSFSYFLCDSRSSEFGIVILILLNIFLPLFKKSKIFKKIVVFLPITMLCLSIVSVILYKQNFSIAYTLNDILSNRIKHAYNFMDYYGINLFGHFFEYYGRLDHYYYLSVLDNAYINLLIQFGIILTFIMIYIYTIIIKKAVQNNKYEIVILMILLSFYGLMEHYIFVIVYSPILMAFSDILYLKKRDEKCNLNDRLISDKERKISNNEKK